MAKWHEVYSIERDMAGLREENERLREQLRQAQERLRAYEADRQRMARSGE
jgi:FtsZ-binding cell division protein ZapB